MRCRILLKLYSGTVYIANGMISQHCLDRITSRLATSFVPSSESYVRQKREPNDPYGPARPYTPDDIAHWTRSQTTEQYCFGLSRWRRVIIVSSAKSSLFETNDGYGKPAGKLKNKKEKQLYRSRVKTEKKNQNVVFSILSVKFSKKKITVFDVSR